MRRRSGLVGGLWRALFAVAALTPASADAYVRSLTKSTALPLYWHETDIVFHLDVVGSDDLQDNSELEAVRTSFKTWNDVACPNGPFRMTLREGSLVTSPLVEHVEGGDNRNIIKWVETRPPWLHSLAVIGVTSATYDARDGRILDADIEFNGVHFTYTTTGSPLQIQTDVQNTATHEIGHLLGLDHTFVTGATMEARAPPGETSKRTLTDDDVVGVCHVEPPPYAIPPGEVPKEETEGCVFGMISPGPTAAQPGAAGLLWLLGLVVLGGLRVRRINGPPQRDNRRRTTTSR